MARQYPDYQKKYQQDNAAALKAYQKKYRQANAAKAKAANIAWKKANPIRVLWLAKKHRAKERGIAFTLTFEQFKEICETTEYHEYTGRGKGFASLDRKVNEPGYTEGNIGIMSVGANASKQRQSERSGTWYSLEDDKPIKGPHPFKL